MGKIPAKAKKVFQGEIFSVWQWPQKMYDGSIQTFEMIKRDSTVEVIATTNNKKILILKQCQPDREKSFYSLPGGRVDYGENSIEGAKRELKEETGFESVNWQLLSENNPHHKIEWINYTYIAKNCKKTTHQRLDVGEKINVFEVSFEEFLDFVLFENFRSGEIKTLAKNLLYDKKQRIEFENSIF